MEKKLTNKEKAKIYDLTVLHVASEMNRCKMFYLVNEFKRRKQPSTEHEKIMMEFYYGKIETLRPIYFLYLLDLSSCEMSTEEFLNDANYLPT